MNQTPTVMPRHGNQTLINLMQMKSETIASDSPRFTLKLIEDQGCKFYDKRFGLFVKNLSFSWNKKGFFIFCNSGVFNVWMCCVESIPPWTINQKILPGSNRVKTCAQIKTFFEQKILTFGTSPPYLNPDCAGGHMTEISSFALITSFFFKRH